MMEAEDEKRKQMAILEEYKSMIDFGTREARSVDTEAQTSLSLPVKGLFDGDWRGNPIELHLGNLA